MDTEAPKYQGRPCRLGHTTKFVSNGSCVECEYTRSKLWRINNREKYLACKKLYRTNNPDKVKAYNASRDPIENRLRSSRWKKANLAKTAANEANRRARKIQATPFWANKDLIEYFYIKAKFMTWFTGVPHEVDHIVPLRGKNVCGLHVENNLQVIPEIENVKKGNR